MTIRHDKLLSAAAPANIVAEGVLGQNPGARLERLKACAAAVAVVALSCAIYLLGPHNARGLGRLYGTVGFSFTGTQFLIAAGAGYAALLAPYCFLFVDPAASKSLRRGQSQRPRTRSECRLRWPAPRRDESRQGSCIGRQSTGRQVTTWAGRSSPSHR